MVVRTKQHQPEVELADDALLLVMSFLDARDLCACASVSVRFRSLSESNTIWQPLCKHDWILDITYDCINNRQNQQHQQQQQHQGAMMSIDTSSPGNIPGNSSTSHIESSDSKRSRANDQDDDTIMFNNTSKRRRRVTLSPEEELAQLIARIRTQEISRMRSDCYQDLQQIDNHICKLVYREYFDQFRGLAREYKRCKTLWIKLENYLKDRSPVLFSSILDGASKKLSDILEERCEDGYIPNELKCIYRIHNGQNKACPIGLFGSYDFYNYMANVLMFSIEDMISNRASVLNSRIEELSWVENCIPIAGRRKVFILLVTKNFQLFSGHYKYKTGQVVQLTNTGAPFILADSYIEWFETFVNNLTEHNMYDIDREGHIIRYPTNAATGSDTTTKGVRIQCNALFIPEYSQLMPDNESYFFAYRIRMSMSPDEPKNLSCQLTTRNWLVKDANGKEDSVEGPGVIGMYPVMKPGATFSYCSCTQSDTTTGSMEGYFTMKSLTTGIEFNARIDPYELNIRNHL